MSGKQRVVLEIAMICLVAILVVSRPLVFYHRNPAPPDDYVAPLVVLLLSIGVLVAAIWVAWVGPGPLPLTCASIVGLLAVVACYCCVRYGLFPPPRVSCMSNLRQLALGTIMYAQDYGDRLPRAADWTEALYPYVKDYRLYKCPGDPRRPFILPGRRERSLISYGANLRLSGAKTDDIAEPSRSIWLFDCYQQAVAPDAAAWWHNHGANFAFVDGHVKWLKREGVESMQTSGKGTK
jgi:prepilin-type processing-associated H-X9-DG protein